MPNSITSIAKKLSTIKDRISMRKQSDLRECHSIASSLLPVLRCYKKAKDSGFKRENVEKVDIAIEKALI